VSAPQAHRTTDPTERALEAMPAPSWIFAVGAEGIRLAFRNGAARRDYDPADDVVGVLAGITTEARIRAALELAVASRARAQQQWTLADGEHCTATVTPLGEQRVLLHVTTNHHDGCRSPARRQRERAVLDWLSGTTINRANLGTVLRQLNEQLTDLFACDRASVWLFTRGQHELQCIDSYVASRDEHESGSTLQERDFAREFEALRSARFVAPDDLYHDPRTAGYVDTYLRPNRITAMLDATIRLGNLCYGTVCIEHVDEPRRWLPREVDFACMVASHLSVLLEAMARAEAERRVRAKQKFLHSVVDGSPIGIQFFSPEGYSLRMNPAMQKLLGLPSPLIGVGEYNVLHDPVAKKAGIDHWFREALAGRASPIERRLIDFAHADYAHWPLNRRQLWLESVYFPVYDDAGAVIEVVAFSWDVTERVRERRTSEQLEARLRQSQKLEAVGLLAGGIAHDFNNILTAVIGFTDLLHMQFGNTPSAADLLRQIRSAADRGSALIRQLLAFGRQEITRPVTFDPAHAIAELLPMLRRLLEANIQLELHVDDSAPIHADRGQFQQVLMNLLINARDAMPHGGSVRIDVRGDDEALGVPGIRITVRDTGTGMPPEVRQRVFEPFFTTKQPGKGTGLGLSTVYGIVVQAKGRIDVETAVGKGSTFHVLWPLATDADDAEGPTHEALAPEVAPAAARTEPGADPLATVLVVEDDDANRALAQRALELHGYRVLAAANGEQALAIAEATDEIDLLLTDVVMPGIGGREVAERLVAARQDLRVVFTSGFMSDDLLRFDIAEAEVDFLQKPYGPEELAATVRQALARGD
jgi:signal transduction histidine kinase